MDKGFAVRKWLYDLFYSGECDWHRVHSELNACSDTSSYLKFHVWFWSVKSIKPSHVDQLQVMFTVSEFLNNFQVGDHINPILQQTDHLLLIWPVFHINLDPAVNPRPAHMKAIALGLFVWVHRLWKCADMAAEREREREIIFKDTKVAVSKSQSVFPAASELKGPQLWLTAEHFLNSIR